MNRINSSLVIGFLLSIALVGCASIDLETHVQKLSDEYGAIQSRMDCNGRITYYRNGSPDKPFTELANISVNLSATQIGGQAAWPPDQMIAYMVKTACEHGADSMINVKVEMRNVGLTTSTAPFVSGTAVRFKDTANEVQVAGTSEISKTKTEQTSYQEFPFKKAANDAFADEVVNKRIRFTVAFNSIFAPMGDLPSEYRNGWVRIIVVDPEGVGSQSSFVLVPKDKSDIVFDLKTGEKIVLFTNPVMVSRRSGAKYVIFRVEEIQREK